MSGSEKVEHQKQNDVLSGNMGGGPHGLGNPDDRSLRVVERDILVPKKMREKAKVIFCAPEIEAFGKCGVEQQYMMPFRCRQQARELKICLAAAYQNDEFIKKCTEEYLDERSEYRRTGIPTNSEKKQMGST